MQKPGCRSPRRNRRQFKERAGNSELRLKQGELAIARAKLVRDKAANRLHILKHHTKEKQTRQFQTDVMNASSNERAKEATWELGAGKEEKLRRPDCVSAESRLLVAERWFMRILPMETN